MIGFIIAAALGAAAARPLDKLDKKIRAADRQRQELERRAIEREDKQRQEIEERRIQRAQTKRGAANEAPLSRNRLAARPVSDVAHPQA